MLIKCHKAFLQFLGNESGATAIEYGMLVAILAVGVILGVTGIAVIATDMWNGVGADVASAQ